MRNVENVDRYRSREREREREREKRRGADRILGTVESFFRSSARSSVGIQLDTGPGRFEGMAGRFACIDLVSPATLTMLI